MTTSRCCTNAGRRSGRPRGELSCHRALSDDLGRRPQAVAPGKGLVEAALSGARGDGFGVLASGDVAGCPERRRAQRLTGRRPGVGHRRHAGPRLRGRVPAPETPASDQAHEAPRWMPTWFRPSRPSTSAPAPSS